MKLKYTRATRKESLTEVNKSAITDHVNQHNHEIDWDNDKILAREMDKKRRSIKEAIHIRQQGKSIMNKDQGNHQLSFLYNNFSTSDGSTSLPLLS